MRLHSHSSMVGSTAVCFSGGGARAYVAALGQLEGLRSLGLLEEVDHVAGVSGGAWAAAVNCWAPPSSSQPLIAPEDLSWRTLRTLEDDAPHGAVVRSDVLQLFARHMVSGLPTYEAWRMAVHSTRSSLQPNYPTARTRCSHHGAPFASEQSHSRRLNSRSRLRGPCPLRW